MESVLAANGDTLVDDLNILGEELVQSHIGLKGDVVEPPSTTTPTSRFCCATPKFSMIDPVTNFLLYGKCCG
jgi:hypothetical protein